MLRPLQTKIAAVFHAIALTIALLIATNVTAPSTPVLRAFHQVLAPLFYQARSPFPK
ncbi:MAG: hypothetical protein MUF49_16475 [Oculatellaceae cyanobacterium Prado106]|nr:hypothetical protein [Oculatellaceae cyanobacterium Prado106]